MVEYDADGAPDSPARVVAVIPARADSRRLPDKPLKLLGGEPLVCRVLRRVAECRGIDEVLVVTDDVRVARAVRECGGRVVFDDATRTCGTERVAHAVAEIEADYVLNVQVDQAFVEPEALTALVACLEEGAPIATLAAPLGAGDSPHVVKVSCEGGRATRFTRQATCHHVGVYGFSRAALDAVARLPRSPRAEANDLEQLTWMDAGWPIHVVHGSLPSLSIDTPEDLAAAQERLS